MVPNRIFTLQRKHLKRFYLDICNVSKYNLDKANLFDPNVNEQIEHGILRNKPHWKQWKFKTFIQILGKNLCDWRVKNENEYKQKQIINVQTSFFFKLNTIKLYVISRLEIIGSKVHGFTWVLWNNVNGNETSIYLTMFCVKMIQWLNV